MIYIPRDRWRPRHGVGNPTPGPQSRVIIHHAPERALAASPTHDEIAGQIRIMEDYQARVHTPGNPRISYHWVVVEQTGEVWEGLGWDRIGAHVGGHNTASLGVLVLGVDGSVTAGSDRTWRAIAGLVQEGIRRGSLVADPEISPHNRYVSTVCPGGVLQRHVEQLTAASLIGLLQPAEPPEPVVDLVPDSTRRPTPEPDIPPRVTALLSRPAAEAMTDFAQPGETMIDAVCRLLDVLLRLRGDRLPVWLPEAIARRVLTRIIGCAFLLALMAAPLAAQTELTFDWPDNRHPQHSGYAWTVLEDGNPVGSGQTAGTSLVVTVAAEPVVRTGYNVVVQWRHARNGKWSHHHTTPVQWVEPAPVDPPPDEPPPWEVDGVHVLPQSATLDAIEAHVHLCAVLTATNGEHRAAWLAPSGGRGNPVCEARFDAWLEDNPDVVPVR